MKKNNLLLSGIGIAALLLVASIGYLLLADRDVYKYHTGLGSKIAISNDDQQIAFSFYRNGSEAIYIAKLDGKDVHRVSNPVKADHRQPTFSPDGKKLLYLSQNRNRIQSLYIANSDGTNPEKLSKNTQHVTEAIFSDDNKTIFFASTAAENVNKSEGETKDGLDLFSVKIDGTEMEQLTDRDFYTMESLYYSPKDKQVIFKDFNDTNSFDLEEGRVYMADFSSELPNDYFNMSISPDNELVAYTKVSEESMDSSLFEYDLYLKDLKNGESKRLTDLNSSVVSPIFFNNKDEILFLDYTNWPKEPEEYKLMTVELETKKLREISLDLPALERENFVMKAVDYSINGWTLGILYTVLFMLITLYIQAKKVFLPAFISLGIGMLSIAASFVFAIAVDPWAGIGVGMLAASLLVCSAVLFIFALILKLYRKGAK
ncbi:PD40 domain-containing protein [Bacillus sp. ISL-35]|uniref:TolB family protein n=1 Tax=Bacillus sp. ISL-35 TaxID=2819122 RepID=UPI001BE93874|nr:PD40 domain-containing protein [Bacillus sp. ISL-35]MBT2681190.1 PD40 domain-containing protein [Bacillus sp. ISL-35]MBT2706101.1 PD40 domain-containing protein [Chryseobacterium sp. ISL-80]